MGEVPVKLNVRCCCNGERILGTLEVSQPEAAFIPLTMLEDRPDMRNAPRLPVAVPHNRQMASIQKFARIGLAWEDYHLERAVHSGDRPIEFWRRVCGFVEGDSV